MLRWAVFHTLSASACLLLLVSFVLYPGVYGVPVVLVYDVGHFLLVELESDLARENKAEAFLDALSQAWVAPFDLEALGCAHRILFFGYDRATEKVQAKPNTGIG